MPEANVLGIITFFRNLRYNYWWRWIYLCGGGFIVMGAAVFVLGIKLLQIEKIDDVRRG